MLISFSWVIMGKSLVIGWFRIYVSFIFEMKKRTSDKQMIAFDFPRRGLKTTDRLVKSQWCYSHEEFRSVCKTVEIFVSLFRNKRHRVYYSPSFIILNRAYAHHYHHLRVLSVLFDEDNDFIRSMNNWMNIGNLHMHVYVWHVNWHARESCKEGTSQRPGHYAFNRAFYLSYMKHIFRGGYLHR